MNEGRQQVDPEVEEVTGSLVQRLKLDKHQHNHQERKRTCVTNSHHSSNVVPQHHSLKMKNGTFEEGDTINPITSEVATMQSGEHATRATPTAASGAYTFEPHQESHNIQADPTCDSNDVDGVQSHPLTEQDIQEKDDKCGPQSPVSATKSGETMPGRLLLLPSAPKDIPNDECESGTDSNNHCNSAAASRAVTNQTSSNTNSSSSEDRWTGLGTDAQGCQSSDPYARKTAPQHEMIHNLEREYEHKDDRLADNVQQERAHGVTKEEVIHEQFPSPSRLEAISKTNTRPASSDSAQGIVTHQTVPSNNTTNAHTSSESNSDQSDSGYAASASSNDASGFSSSSSSFGRRQTKRSNHSKTTSNKQKQDYCSSDLTDFSSHGSGGSSSSSSSPRISPFAAGNISEDSETNVAGTVNEKVGTRSLFNDDGKEPSSIESGVQGVERTIARSSFPSRHRRRHTSTKTTRDKQPGLKATGPTNNTSKPKSALKSKEIEPAFKMGNSWSFIERQLKRKLYFEKSYEDQRKELDINFNSAVKRIRHNKSSTSESSMLSSLSNVTSGKEIRNGEHQIRAEASPVYDVGVDVMAKILRYLKPTEAYSILSTPISKTFKSTFSNPPYLWKVLCLSEPFYAKQDKESSDESTIHPVCKDLKVNHLLGRYRLLYSSLIKCVRYLDRIQEDSQNGRTPPGSYDSDTNSIESFDDNDSLKRFLARAHSMNRNGSLGSDSDGSDSSLSQNRGAGQKENPKKRQKSDGKVKLRYGASTLTNRLLGPAHSSGVAGNVGLPWSCAIYSVVNWMVAFADVAGIQLMCLSVLPDLLVDEQQRTSAQNAGLTDIVLRAMVLFPDMVELHTVAFHTLVLLARPLGGKEGMLFHTSMVNASGLFNVGSSTGKSGIAIMLDSMKRFAADEDLQAMSCWSMVNIALIPSQKVALVRLGGISAAANAMIHHPLNAEVQFRALFALINLVIPSANISNNPEEAQRIDDQVAGMNHDSEIDMLNECLEQVTNLVVVAMKNFCSSEAILNRACLVLHNLSLKDIYHRVLLLTPNCYQMLEWCIGNYRHDKVLQSSANGTLQRLQITLNGDHFLREEFRNTIRAQKLQQQLPRENHNAPEENSVNPSVN